MTDSFLEVWCFGEVAGTLVSSDTLLSFSYAPSWLHSGRPPLSQSLPVDGSYTDVQSFAFFDGLLPEGELRDLIGLRLGVSSTNDFALLERLGGDCAGAISLYTPGMAAAPRFSQIEWLSDGDLRQLVEELPSRPMYAEPGGGLRLSLAGAQDKIPVVFENGRVGLPVGDQHSTHILKTPIRRLP